MCCSWGMRARYENCIRVVWCQNWRKNGNKHKKDHYRKAKGKFGIGRYDTKNTAATTFSFIQDRGRLNILGVVYICDLHGLIPSLAYTWIKECIDQFGQEIRDEHSERNDQETAFNQSIVAVLYCLIQIVADPWIVENHLTQQSSTHNQT